MGLLAFLFGGSSKRSSSGSVRQSKNGTTFENTTRKGQVVIRPASGLPSVGNGRRKKRGRK